MYTQRISSGPHVNGSSAAILLDCSGANTVEFSPGYSALNVLYLYGQVQTTFNSTGNTVVTVYYRPTPGSSSGQVSLGTLSIPTAAAAPALYYKAVVDNVCYGSGSIAFVVTTAASSAGKIYCSFEGNISPEVPANIPSAVASA